jgi:hypothetical protein
MNYCLFFSESHWRKKQAFRIIGSRIKRTDAFRVDAVSQYMQYNIYM